MVYLYNMRQLIKSLFILAFVFTNLTLIQAKEEGSILESTHFAIHYKVGAYDFALKVKEKAEEYYRQIIEELGFSQQKSFLKERKVKIYIYRDQNEYVAQTGQPEWSAGCANYQERSISGYRLANGFLFQILPHELGHVVFREFVGFNPNIPVWLDEGVACFVEPQRKWLSKRRVREALRKGELIPLEKLSTSEISRQSDPEKVELFYAESVNIVDFLVEKFGKEKFSQFCLSLKEWATLEETLQKHYPYKNLEELNKAWVANLK